MSIEPVRVGSVPPETPPRVAAPKGLPTRTDIDDWVRAIADLSTAAAEYRQSANILDSISDAHCHALSAPGGTDWCGDGADAAREAGYADRGVVWQATDHIRDNLARAADEGAQIVNAARNRVQDAIELAEQDGFTVGDDLSVSDTRTYTDMSEYTARQAKAEEHSRDIAKLAGDLVAKDVEAGEILGIEATALDTMIPTNWAIGAEQSTEDSTASIQTVSNQQGAPQSAQAWDSTGQVMPEGPAAPIPHPSLTRWDGPPPAGEAERTGYWAVDTSRSAQSPSPMPAPAPYRSAPPSSSNLEGATSGPLTVGGASPQRDDAVGFDLQNTYKFRITGTEFTGQTRMVQIDGAWYQAQWHSYNYEMNKIPIAAGTGKIPALQFPVMSQANEWTPVTVGQIMQENAKYPSGATFYLPNPFGNDSLTVSGGALNVNTPVVPVMTRGD